MTRSRRAFLSQLSSAGLVSLSGLPPTFLTRACLAAETAGAAEASEGRILVLIQLAGGNDGLNTVIPYAQDEYYKARPGIGIPRQAVRRLNDELGLHPALRGFQELYDEGRLAIVQGVGYPHPDRSHFRSMDIWQSARVVDAETEVDTRDGWIGRALDQIQNEVEGGVPAVALGTERLPLSLVSTRINVPTIRDVRGYRFETGAGPQRQQSDYRDTLLKLSHAASGENHELDFLRRTMTTAVTSAERLQDVARQSGAGMYPATGLAQKLKTVAQMIAGEFGTRVFFVSLDGFDTHSQQSGAHQALLAELAGAVRAFMQDLVQRHLDDRVLVATFSEFGRRVAENGSLGTDHGSAAQMFLVTPANHGGIIGPHPSLRELHQGDLQFHTDFRQVYATLLEDWLSIPSAPVLEGAFEKLPVLRGV